ncbi:hemocyte protein-glutamine gamma-glutamyltransferase-like [Rhodnius prolixus]|uniref:hemocyte protein-glutamine gamma-glutamyltransferase-like n=1 Tax=Rhodnius prolixus TaxID=13249 RepID=UPI003D18A44E
MALKVSSVNLYPLENAKAHNTYKFEAVHLSPPTAIFRRGQEFDLEIVFSNRSFNSQVDKLRIIFNYEDEEKKPQSPRGGAWLVDSEDLADDPNVWSLRTIKNEGKSLKLKMKTPVICAVGAWTIKIKLDLRSRLGGSTYEHPDLVYILFNPWNKNDTVYMPDTHLLEEYVMNDVGKVYVGNQVSSVGRQWLFGQFEAHVLPICRKVLEPTWEELSYNKRCDPIYVSRACSGVGKILQGNWSGDYEGGTNPSLWTGSAPILKEYSITGSPVKYGQCWVFASLGCSVCRALGIPARVVTNIISAQDYDESLTIDKYFDAAGELIRGESLWNFHAWIDVWLARPDLPLGYGGWQAVDPTMSTGPSSLEAIKRGEVGYAFDVPEKISEVNADLVDWKVDEEALLGFKKIKTVTNYVGYQMLTKRPHIFDPSGERDRDDVMYQYKNPEGTKEERLALLRAAMHCSSRSCAVFELEDAKQLVEIKFSISKIEKIHIGKSFTIILDIENTVGEKRKVQLVFTLFSLYYNGNKANNIKKIVQTIELAPNEKKQFQANITSEDYVDKLVEFSLMKLYLIATVDETKQTFVGEEDYQVIKPTLTIQAVGSLSVGKPGKIVFQLKNPLKKKLTECVLAFDGPGILKYQKNSFRDVLPEENFKMEATVTPSTSGKLTLVAIFYSKELQDIMGSALIDVTS